MKILLISLLLISTTFASEDLLTAVKDNNLELTQEIIEEGEFEILIGGNPKELLKQKIYFKN